MIENTSKNPRHEWLLGGDRECIERQEAQGQRQLVRSSRLPATGLTIEDAARCGITIVKETPDDDLFVDVVLQPGWALKPTEHSMWSELVDDKGVTRARIFYKAAFYDRCAFIGFTHDSSDEG